MATSPSSRIVVIDVLRAVALLGIVITHAAMGFHAAPPPAPNFMLFDRLDRVVSMTVGILADGKFFAIFSFLFGVSFAIQLESASRHHGQWAGRFAWRCTTLFGIGAVHQLVFNGDILMIYALLGLLLIPLAQVRSTVLVIVAAMLVLNVPGQVLAIARAVRPSPPAEQQAAVQEGERFQQSALRQYEANKFGSLSELAQVNWSDALKMKMSYQFESGRLWITFGCFLLGVCAGRVRVFDESDASRRLFKMLLFTGGGAALASTAAMFAFVAAPPATSLLSAVRYFTVSVMNASLPVAYVAAVTLIFWRRAGVLRKLAPLGKMGLTTYLMQTMAGCLLFYGIGLGMLGELSVASAVGLGLMFFGVQLAFAHLWTNRFTMGPVEWFWRRLTQLGQQQSSS